MRELGEIHVNDWELPEFLNKDITELEISRAVQRLGQVQVTDWDLKDVVPALQKLAKKEVDIVSLLKNAANYKINDWDVRKALLSSRAKANELSKQEVEAISKRLQNYLRYMVDQLVDEPEYANIVVEELAPQVLRFRVMLKQRDLSMFIGMNGYTANPVRRILKETALQAGICAILQIQTHEEAAREDGV